MKLYSVNYDESLIPFKCGNRVDYNKDNRHNDWQIIQYPDINEQPTLKSYWGLKCNICEKELFTLFTLVTIDNIKILK